MNALKRQGIYLVASCGGKGICGKCRVRILEGGHRTVSTAKLKPDEIEKGTVLACRTYADEDITIDIPKESKMVIGDAIEISRSQDLFQLFKTADGKISPIVKWLGLDIPPPTLDNNIGDLERLKKATKRPARKGWYFRIHLFHYCRSLSEMRNGRSVLHIRIKWRLVF